MKYIYVEDGILNGAGEAVQTGEGVICAEVSDEIYEGYIADNLKYAYDGEKIVENPDYELALKAQQARARIDEILIELDELDKKRIRAVCEDEVKNPKSGETWLDYYNAQIYDLRMEMKSLEAML